MRIDGMLSERHILPPDVRLECIARIKILAAMRSDEHNAAQDGRFRYRGEGGELDIRVSVMPTYHGENAVLRLLGGNGELQSLTELGFSASDAELFGNVMKRTSGLVLATGPTGSGKTTTLYALMRLINADVSSVVTIEDPIEYAMPGVRQIPVRERQGLTFGTGLRSVLRQDPDTIMVGEIRDTETAKLAVNAALTGHLVLSSLHTTDAASAIPRLLDMEAEPYLLASTLSLIVAQRLVRRICTACAGAGCEPCRKSGYRGRLCIYESLSIDDALREAILERKSAGDIRKLTEKHGLKTMLVDGTEKAAFGATTMDEVLRTLHE